MTLMNKLEKIELIKKKLSELTDFKEKLNSENLKDFNRLKSEILNLLDGNQKIRFNRIEFYSETQGFSGDEIPF